MSETGDVKPADSLDTVRLMLGYLCIATEAEAALDRKVEILDRFSLTDKEISIICGCAPQSVRNARQLLRKFANAKTRRKA